MQSHELIWLIAKGEEPFPQSTEVIGTAPSRNEGFSSPEMQLGFHPFSQAKIFVLVCSLVYLFTFSS